MIAVFEVTPGSSQATNRLPDEQQQLAAVTINYNLPGKKEQLMQVYECINNYKPLEQLDHYFSFATSVCMFGGFLHSSPYLKKATWDDVVNLTKASMDVSNPLHTEFFDMVVKAKKIYEPSKKRKRRNRDER